MAPWLSVLDFGDLDPIEIAEHAEARGYGRFWLAEHHGLGGHYVDPLMMSVTIAGTTDAIRVGTAGVLLRFHSPIAIANAARMLEWLYPGRIDLGLAIGDAAPDYRDAQLDGRPNRNREQLAQRTRDVVAYLRNEAPIRAEPDLDTATPVWVLGGSRGSAELAAGLGAAFCASLIHGTENPDPGVLDSYRQAFRPSAECPEPLCAIAVAGQCSEGPTGPLPRNFVVRPTYAGGPDACRAAIFELRERYRADEVVHLDLSPDVETRLTSLALLASACGLVPRPTAAASSP